MKLQTVRLSFVLLGCLVLSITPGLSQDEMAGIEKRVQRIFEATYDDICGGSTAIPADEPIRVFRSTFNYRDEEGEPRPFALVQLHCSFGAYNQTSVFYQANDYGEIRQVQFAVPAFHVSYEDDDYQEQVEEITTSGFSTYDLLVNATVDPETLTVHHMSYWRGLGDASSTGTWIFEDGGFVLVSFDVDPTYDGEVNPQRIYGQGEPEKGE